MGDSCLKKSARCDSIYIYLGCAQPLARGWRLVRASSRGARPNRHICSERQTLCTDALSGPANGKSHQKKSDTSDLGASRYQRQPSGRPAVGGGPRWSKTVSCRQSQPCRVAWNEKLDRKIGSTHWTFQVLIWPSKMAFPISDPIF